MRVQRRLWTRMRCDIRRKVAVIGAGNVGAVAGYCVAKENYADVVYIDVVPGMPQAKGHDVASTAEFNHFLNAIEGSNDYAALKDASVVIHTAGLPRKPGMDRMDLLKTNVAIANTAGNAIKKYAPQAIVIVVANPLDVITLAMHRATGFPSQRVFGMAGTLDATRFRYFVAQALGVWPGDVDAMVMGGHGDTMVPLPQYCSVNAIPAGGLLDRTALTALSDRTRTGGGEIVGLLKVGGAYYAPGASAAVIANAILTGVKRIEPVSTLLHGEYGVRDLFLGVPAIISAQGVERVLELKLDDGEQQALEDSADHVRAGVRMLDGLE